MPFRILTVCTGNICRSPQAEQLLRAGFETARAADAAWELPHLSSAGVHAFVGEAMPAPAAGLSREFGGNPDSHVARQLTRELVEGSDLILAMAREHRGAIARLSPKASRYTFTLRELARIVRASDEADVVPAPGDFAAWLAHAARFRGYHAGTLEEDDVVDPYRRADEVYRESAEQIVPAVRAIVGATIG
jgi:protein-tyrosine phosphatase